MKNCDIQQSEITYTRKLGKQILYVAGALTALVTTGAVTAVSAQADSVDTTNSGIVDSVIATSTASIERSVASMMVETSLVATSEASVASSMVVVQTTAENIDNPIVTTTSLVATSEAPAASSAVAFQAIVEEDFAATIKSTVVPLSDAVPSVFVVTAGDRVIQVAGLVNDVINTIAKATIIGIPVGWVSSLVYGIISTITRVATTTTDAATAPLSTSPLTGSNAASQSSQKTIDTTNAILSTIDTFLPIISWPFTSVVRNVVTQIATFTGNWNSYFGL